MSSQSEPQGSPPPDETPQGRAVALVQSGPVPAREIRVVVDPAPIFDTAKFEHLQRVATAMARTSTVPESLKIGREGGQDVALPFEVVQANCFQVANQAYNWKMDPFAVAQCASIIHGKLMWEGKLVAAVIDAKLGIRLKYTFVNDTPERRADDQSLGIIVSGQFHDEDEPRTIEGTVLRWHKGAKSPWANPADWKRQLRYMGAREWARAHAPAIMLGVIAEDEADEAYAPRPIVPRHLPPPTTISTVAQAEKAAEESLRKQAAAEAKTAAEASRPIPVRGKRPPPPPPPTEPQVDFAAQDVSDVNSKAALLAELAARKTADAVLIFQSANSAKIIGLSTEDREEIIDEIEKARAKFGGK